MLVNLVCLSLLFAGCLVSDLAAQSGASRKWVCTGEITQYTDSDCEQQGAVKKMAVDGCFLVPGLSQYKSCGLTCNDALVGSVKESRCDSDCPLYLANKCLRKTVEKIIPSEPPTEPLVPATVKEPEKVEATSKPQFTIEGKIAVAVVVTLVVTGVIIGVGVYCCHKKKMCCFKKGVNGRKKKKDTDEKSTETDNPTQPPADENDLEKNKEGSVRVEFSRQESSGNGGRVNVRHKDGQATDADHVKEHEPLLGEAGAAGESKPSPPQVDEKYKTMTQDTDSSLTVDVHVPDGTQTPTEEQPSEETQTHI